MCVKELPVWSRRGRCPLSELPVSCPQHPGEPGGSLLKIKTEENKMKIKKKGKLIRVGIAVTDLM